jgi:D-alanine-D-alanine ligase
MRALTKKKKIGVFMGGTSEEKEISLLSGEAVIAALKELGYNAVPVVLNDDSLAALDRSHIDVAFIAMHGKFGEDGELASLLEEKGIPYTGSKPLSSRVAMNKVMAKWRFEEEGIPTPAYLALEGNFTSTEADWLIRQEFGYPCVVKPVASGSSIGVTILENAGQLPDALTKASGTEHEVLVEKYIAGREITCGILADRPLPLIELKPRSRFFDFHAKYEDPGTEHIVNPDLSEAIKMELQSLALAAHNAVGAKDFSRVDMILDNSNQPWVLEVNTIPGLTNKSLFPKAAKALGIDFPHLCEMLTEMAFKSSHAQMVCSGKTNE